MKLIATALLGLTMMAAILPAFAQGSCDRSDQTGQN